MADEKNVSEVSLRFGKNLYTLRKKNKMSMRELAAKLDVSQNSVWFYEKGERTPTLEKILQISELFSVSIDSLLKADVTENEVKEIPAAFILNGKRFDFKVDREQFEKAQDLTITISAKE